MAKGSANASEEIDNLLGSVHKFFVENDLKKSAKQLAKEVKMLKESNVSLVEAYNHFYQTKKSANTSSESSTSVSSSSESSDSSSESLSSSESESEQEKSKSKQSEKQTPSKLPASKQIKSVTSVPVKRAATSGSDNESSSSESSSSSSDSSESSSSESDSEDVAQKNQNPKKKARVESVVSSPASSTPNSKFAKQNNGKGKNEPFRRIKSEDITVDERLQDNSYEAKFGAKGAYGERANNILKHTKGKSFRHEKTKKKRAGYRGGSIDMAVHSIKFDSDSD